MCNSCNQIIYIMSVLVIYHMVTFFGIGYRSEHIHGGHPCTGGYVYGERRRHYLRGIHGEYPFAGGDIYNLQ